MTVPKMVLYLKKVYICKVRPLFGSGNFPEEEMKKPIRAPIILDNKEDHGSVVQMPEEDDRHYPGFSMNCVLLMLLLVVATFVACGVLLYQQYTRPPPRRYTGYCSIPIQGQGIRDYAELLNDDAETIEPLMTITERHVMPLHWSSEPDVRITFSDEAGAAAGAQDELREQFDVDARVESIRVFDNGRTITFIHDFNDNYTGIVDQDRCFLMSMDPLFVVPPEILVVGMETGSEFDVSRVRSSLRAALPALQGLVDRARALADRCSGRPTYQLAKETHASKLSNSELVRKRSVDSPPHDYMQFAGRHVQEIEISNLADVLQAEQLSDNK